MAVTQETAAAAASEQGVAPEQGAVPQTGLATPRQGEGADPSSGNFPVLSLASQRQAIQSNSTDVMVSVLKGAVVPGIFNLTEEDVRGHLAFLRLHQRRDCLKYLVTCNAWEGF